jgi:hypothetical protein
MMQKHRPSKKSTAWPRWLPDVGLDDPEATSTEALHRIPVAINRQMVDDPEATSTKELHRVAAVAT